MKHVSCLCQHTDRLTPSAWHYKPLKCRVSCFPGIWSYYGHQVGLFGLGKDPLYGLHRTTQSTSIVSEYQIHIPDKPSPNMWQNLKAQVVIGGTMLPITCVCVCVCVCAWMINQVTIVLVLYKSPWTE